MNPLLLTQFLLILVVGLSSSSIVPPMDDRALYNACNCSVGLDPSKLIPAVSLLDEEIGYKYSVHDECNWTAFRSCVGQCVIFFPAFSNNFDLSLPPNVPSANGTSLNDLLCQKLQDQGDALSHSFASRAHLYATLKCFVTDETIETAATEFMSGSLMFSQQFVDCDARN